MRLTCPNCGAQYEVPDEVIPRSGRDVQCSNCGVTWFQHHSDHLPPPDEDEETAAWEHPDIEDAEIVDDAETPPDQAPEPEPQPEEMPQRRPLDSAVTDVLREEAERERAARAVDSGGLETQPELGLSEADDESTRRQTEAQTRMARLRGEPEQIEDASEPDPDPGTRRNLLPDIDEINSSLDSDAPAPPISEQTDTGDTNKRPQSGGFRRGFLFMVLIAVIGLLLYMFAPQLAQSVPALEGVMAGYVAFVDGLRSWLDDTVRGLMGTLDGMSTESN